MTDEGVLDPWVAEGMAGNPIGASPLEDLSPEVLELAGVKFGMPSKRDIQIGRIDDELVGDVPVRIYQPDRPTGIVVYFHGGGFVMGSIGIMDKCGPRPGRRLSGAVVISVEYRLAPENPYPAGLDDCEAVTRWGRRQCRALRCVPSVGGSGRGKCRWQLGRRGSLRSRCRRPGVGRPSAHLSERGRDRGVPVPA